MADTPNEGAPDAPAVKPAPRRRTRSTAAAAPKARRSTAKSASAADDASPTKARAKPGPKPKAKPEATAGETRQKASRKPRTVRAKATETVKVAAKPKNRAKVIAGVAAAVLGVGSAVAAVMGRKKIAAVSGDVMEAVTAKVEEVRADAGPASGTIEVPSQPPVPPVS